MEDLENPFGGLAEAVRAHSVAVRASTAANVRMRQALEDVQETLAATFDAQKRLIDGFFGSPE